jgi:hypothetical protein
LLPEVLPELYIGSPFFSVTHNLTSFLCSVGRLTGGTREKSNHEESFLLWKREKDKLLKQKKTEQKIQNEKIKSDNEKKAAAEMVSQISLNLIFPKLLAKSKSSEPSPNKVMLLREVYLGSYPNFSCFWLHFNIILVTFQVVAFKEISTPNCQNQQLVVTGKLQNITVLFN